MNSPTASFDWFRRRSSSSVSSLNSELLELLTKTPALPFIPGDLLASALHFCGQVPEAAHKLIVNYCRARQNMRKVFRNRHPGCVLENTQNSAVRVGTVSEGNSSDWVIFCVWLNDADPAAFNIYQPAKLIFTYLDMLLQKNCVWNKKLGLVIDLIDFSDRHVELVTRFSAMQIIRLCKNAFPINCGPVLLVNSGENVSQLTGLMAPFDFHIVADADDLSGFLPKEYLPCDLGGNENNPSRQDLDEKFIQLLWSHGSRLAFEEIGWDKCYMDRITLEEPKPKAEPKKKKSKSKRSKKSK